ncbi:S-adenosyl-L-methionine-dependent methyltransferase [Xylogone sp. PMI_703]|nr:S-adenosyl-L-methionine-dependent methyltransferase [Xylogone sp. PMI_703]
MVVQAKAGDWEAFAETYKRITEGTSRKPVQAMLESLNTIRPFKDAVGILDNGCGPGTIMSQLIKEYGTNISSSCSLTCSDYAPAMIEQVRKTQSEAVSQDPATIWNRVQGKVLDSLDLEGIDDGSQSHVAAGLLYNLTVDPQKCLAECRRILQPKGALAVSAWEGNDWVEMMKVLLTIKPELKDAVSAKWTDALAIKTDLEKAGFQEVEVQRVPVQVAFESHNLFVDTLLTYQPRMVALLRDFSDEQKTTAKELLIDAMKGYCPEEPGTLNGTVLVGTCWK